MLRMLSCVVRRFSVVRFRAMTRLMFAAASCLAARADEAGATLQRCEFVEPHMGTLFQLVLFAPDAAAAKPAATAAFARIAELNRIMSDYDPESEVMRLCRSPVGTAVRVSAELFAVLQRSQELAEKTGGAFDVTLGPVIRLWREARRTRKLPTDGQRTAALRATGFSKLRLNAAERTVTLLGSGMQLDLGGIAKGYAADEALAVLARCGFSRAMVAASGDLAFGDAPPGKRGWTVEIAPFGSAAQAPLTLVVANAGVSTSGDTEQFAEIGGVRYSHIVDPATGLGLTAPVAVTVVARRATLADGLATACSVLGFDAGKKIVECWDESVRVIVHRRDAGGAVRRETYGTNPPGLLSTL